MRPRLGAAIALSRLPGAHAQSQPAAGGPADTNAPSPAQRALSL